MGKFIDLGLRKPEEATSQDGWTVSFGGLLGRNSAPRPEAALACPPVEPDTIARRMGRAIVAASQAASSGTLP
jgi:hypothetical protein